MDDPTQQPTESDVREIFDPGPHEDLVCRVCGAVVPGVDPYARVHWEWHEATNGA